MNAKTFLSATFAATIAFGAMISPVSAHTSSTADDATIQVEVVNISDLNLSSDEGQATLKARINSAVNRVCGATYSTISLDERLAVNKCRNKARNAALAAARSQSDQMLARR